MAQNIFAQSAKEALGGSKVMQNRTKIGTNDLIALYPDGITVAVTALIAVLYKPELIVCHCGSKSYRAVVKAVHIERL